MRKSPNGMGLISCYYCKGHSNGMSRVSKLQHLAKSQLLCLLPWIKNLAVPEHWWLEGHLQPALWDPIHFTELPCRQSKVLIPFITLLLLAIDLSGRREGMSENIGQQYWWTSLNHPCSKDHLGWNTLLILVQNLHTITSTDALSHITPNSCFEVASVFSSTQHLPWSSGYPLTTVEHYNLAIYFDREQVTSQNRFYQINEITMCDNSIYLAVSDYRHIW